MRNVVERQRGGRVNVPRKLGQLIVCASGCCCGHTEEGHAAVPTDVYQAEWERRRIRNNVHLTMGGCLGPCELSNVVMLLFDGRTMYFQAIDTPRLVRELYDYVELMVQHGHWAPPTGALAARWFTAFTWEPRPDERPVSDDHLTRRRTRMRLIDLGTGRLAAE